MKNLVNDYLVTGNKKILWNASALATGNYLLQIEVGNKSVTRWIPVLH